MHLKPMKFGREAAEVDPLIAPDRMARLQPCSSPTRFSGASTSAAKRRPR